MEEAEDEAKGPMRRCLATGRIRPKEEMIRFVAGPDDELVPDLAAKLPGRGMWLSPEPDVVNTALKKGLFAKAARKKLKLPADLGQRLETLLRRRCLEMLGLARRSGLVVAGFDQVKEALAKGRVAFRLEACDGAPDGRRKLDGKGLDVAIVSLFSGVELGHALGREHVVHVAVLPGGLARRLRVELNRLSAYVGVQARPESEQDAR
ncbi:MAG: RNA-binding protein [Rhodospirillales bacterium]